MGEPPKIRGKPPEMVGVPTIKWMIYNGKHYFLMDDLGGRVPPRFLETFISMILSSTPPRSPGLGPGLHVQSGIPSGSGSLQQLLRWLMW